MNAIESLLGWLTALGAALMAVLALVVVGTLVIKGPAENRNIAEQSTVAPAVAVSEAPAQTDAETVVTGDNASAAPSDTPAAGSSATPAESTSTPQGAAASADNAAAPPADPAQADAKQAASAVASDPAAGEKVFAKCKACHGAEKDGPNKVGPNLWGIFGHPVAARDGFNYSKAMAAESGKVWDAAMLDAYLTDPKKAMPGNKMVFVGLKKPQDRANVIAWLAQQSDTPVAPGEINLGGAAPAAGEAAASPAAGGDTAAASTQATEEQPAEVATIAPAVDPAPVSAERQAQIDAAVAALRQEIQSLDHERARYHPLHFAPLIEKASDAECLVCHQEILTRKPLPQSPAGLNAIDTLAWYQTLDTYEGDQQTFHWRHIESPFAKKVMNLQCNFCHKGNDPREESPDMVPTAAAFSADAAKPAFTLRKMVNPSETCLLCHGAMPDPVNIMGLGGPWHEVRGDLESEDAPNGCLTCHEELFRTVRHRVIYLKAASIEEVAKSGSDSCHGCHGGRAWDRNSYPYPRNPWPDMDPETPEWAIGRPTESDPQFQLPAQSAQ